MEVKRREQRRGNSPAAAVGDEQLQKQSVFGRHIYEVIAH
jgi:hypothetical protein